MLYAEVMTEGEPGNEMYIVQSQRCLVDPGGEVVGVWLDPIAEGPFSDVS